MEVAKSGTPEGVTRKKITRCFITKDANWLRPSQSVSA